MPEKSSEITWEEVRKMLYDLKGIKASIREIQESLMYNVVLSEVADQIVYMREHK